MLEFHSFTRSTLYLTKVSALNFSIYLFPSVLASAIGNDVEIKAVFLFSYLFFASVENGRIDGVLNKNACLEVKQ